MLRFFKNIRKNLATENKVAPYLRYAIGEILLVVVGILIALQVNNWNENRKSEKEFNFGVSEFTKQFLVDVYSYGSLVDRFTYQVSKMDSIIDDNAEWMNLEHLPGILQVFDDNGNNLINRDTDWQESFLRLNPNDDKQNQLVKSIRKYFQDQHDYLNGLKNLNMDNLMSKYLRDWNIPVRFLDNGTGYEAFIADYPHNFYSEEELNRVLQLTKNPSFIADLKSLNELKKKTIGYSALLTKQGQDGLEYLKRVFPDINYGITEMEIIGLATPNNDWTRGTPMQKTSTDDSTWEITMELTDGAVKFRTDPAWTFDWGMGQANPDKLVFKGSNIPVKKGTYHIIIDIVNGTYEFKPVDEI